MKLIIAGGREFSDYNLLEIECKKFIIDNGRPDMVVFGCARGADTLGEKFAKKYRLPIDRYPANWDKYGKSAGHRRNKEMAQNATHCIVFWDGESTGSANMIEHATNYGLTLKIVKY